jgi:site-specific recombinase XerD
MSEALITTQSTIVLARNFVAEWEAYLDLLANTEEISADTAAVYKRGVARFREWLEQRAPGANGMQEQVVREWVAAMREKGWTVSTRQVMLASLRSFCGWLKAQGLASTDPTAGVKAGKQSRANRHKRDSLTDEQAGKLLRLASLTARDRALVWLMLHTAARGIELCRARIEDLREEEGDLVLYVQGKGRTESDKEPLYIASPDAQRAIRDYLAELAERGHRSGALFVTEREFGGKPRGISRRTLRQIGKGALRAAGIDEATVTTHSLRHKAITKALENGAELRDVQTMARHADINTTLIYVHESARRERAAERMISYDRD